MTVLLTIHVVAAAFWFGASVLFSAIVIPAVADAGASRVFRRTAWTLLSANVITIASGLWLYSMVSGRFSWAFVHSTGGMVLSIGALIGIVAGISGVLAMLSPRRARLFGIASAASTFPALVLMIVSTRV